MADETRMIDPPFVMSGKSFCTKKTGLRALRLNVLPDLKVILCGVSFTWAKAMVAKRKINMTATSVCLGKKVFIYVNMRNEFELDFQSVPPAVAGG